MYRIYTHDYRKNICFFIVSVSHVLATMRSAQRQRGQPTRRRTLAHDGSREPYWVKGSTLFRGPHHPRLACSSPDVVCPKPTFCDSNKIKFAWREALLDGISHPFLSRCSPLRDCLLGFYACGEAL
jgi:hypothetical protein